MRNTLLAWLSLNDPYGCVTNTAEHITNLASIHAVLETPQLVRLTKMRKYTGTVSQILNLKDNKLDWLADHMGHSIHVHRKLYKLTDNTIELAKVAKVLILHAFNILHSAPINH